MIESQPSIYPLGIRIDEPVTALTDLIVSAVCLYAFIKLTPRKDSTKTLFYFGFYFLLMSIATLFGGLIGHAFLYALSFSWKLPGWIISMLATMLLERSAIEYARPHINKRVHKFFLVFNLFELIVILIITMSSLNFKWVEIHSGYGLLAIVLPFQAYTYYKTKDRGSFTIIVAVLIASCAALIFMNKISFHTWFNYLDASHVVIAIAAYVFYKGALRLQKEAVN